MSKVQTNVFFFLLPKNKVSYIADNLTVGEALGVLRASKYTSLPVVNQDGQYIGSISEGDFLWYILDNKKKDVPITEIIRKDYMPSNTTEVNVEELFNQSLTQNFVPIVDDRNVFIGIVTRRSILEYLVNNMVV